MYIDLIIETPPVIEGGSDMFVSNEMQAKLIFRLPLEDVKFWNYGNSPGEAVLNTINSFLAGTEIILEPSYRVRHEYAHGIQFASHIHPDIKAMIEQAIDLKTGNDRNKLTGLIALPG